MADTVLNAIDGHETVGSGATDIVAVIEQNPVVAFTDPKAFNQFFNRVKETASIPSPNVATHAGREEIRKMASKVTRTKTALEAARKKLTEEWRRKTAEVNEAGKEITQRLDALAKEVRKPLTDWEDADRLRQEQCEKTLEWIRSSAIVSLDDTAEAVQARGMEVWKVEITEDRFKDLYDTAVEAKNAAIASLKAAMDRLKIEEKEKAELEALRAEKAEREAREEAEREQRERAEREAEQARLDKEREEQAARLEQERIDLAAREAEERARREAEEEAQRKIDEANERARKAEAEAEAERKRIADQKAAEEAEKRRLEEEQRVRETDADHRAKVAADAVDAIVKVSGITKKAAGIVVLAIIAGEVPNVGIRF